MSRLFLNVCAVVFALIPTFVCAQENDKVKLSQGMLLRVWSDVSSAAQTMGSQPAHAGVVDLGPDFESSRLLGIPQLEPALRGEPSSFSGVEWSGYMKIDKPGKYVMTVTLVGDSSRSSLYVTLAGNRVLTIAERKGSNTVKNQTLNLEAGYYPVSFFVVQTCRYSKAMSFSVKVRPANELDSEPMQVTDFYYRKK